MTPASFICYGYPEGQNRTVHLFHAPNGRWVVYVDNAPGADSFLETKIAVERFAYWRERSARDYGASEVVWGSYRHLQRYWPEEVTPWNVPVG